MIKTYVLYTNDAGTEVYPTSIAVDPVSTVNKLAEEYNDDPDTITAYLIVVDDDANVTAEPIYIN